MSEPNPNSSSPLAVFLSATLLSGFAGLASVLRSGKVLTWVTVLSTFLNSGLFGLAITLVWFHEYQDNVFFLIGCCILSGLMGSSIIDFALEVVKKKIS